MTMSPRSRRFVAGLFRVGLVVLAFAFVARHFSHRGPRIGRMRVQSAAPSSDSLGPGDLRIFNSDSAVDLTLQGDKILAGLSPKMVAKIRAELDTSGAGDTGGLGGNIAKIVKTTVASTIGTHAAFPLADIRDVRYENGALIFDWKDGGTHELFGSVKVNQGKVSNSFRAEDAARFIAAVRARKGESSTTTVRVKGP
jgi:hypothetical protein